MAILVRGAVAAVAAVGVSSSSSGAAKQAHQSNGVLPCRGSAFSRGVAGRLSWAGYPVRERRAAGTLRVTNVAAPVKEQEASTEVGFIVFLRIIFCIDFCNVCLFGV